MAWLALKVCAPLFAFAAVVGVVGALTVYMSIRTRPVVTASLFTAKALFLRDRNQEVGAAHSMAVRSSAGLQEAREVHGGAHATAAEEESAGRD